MCLVIQQSWFPGCLSIYPRRPLSNTNDWHIYSTSLSSDSTKVAVQILRPRSSVVTHASQSGNSRLLGTVASQKQSALAHTAAHAQQWGRRCQSTVIRAAHMLPQSSQRSSGEGRSGRAIYMASGRGAQPAPQSQKNLKAFAKKTIFFPLPTEIVPE